MVVVAPEFGPLSGPHNQAAGIRGERVGVREYAMKPGEGGWKATVKQGAKTTVLAEGVSAGKAYDTIRGHAHTVAARCRSSGAATPASAPRSRRRRTTAGGYSPYMPGVSPCIVH
jgi:hypothetical protein